jgi:hypothetical protein
MTTSQPILVNVSETKRTLYLYDNIITYTLAGKIRIIAENKLKQIKNFPHINEKDKFLAFMQEMNNE